jgi:hypothetical protein
MNPFLAELLKENYDLKKTGNGLWNNCPVNYYELQLKPGVSLPFDHYQNSCEGQKKFLFEVNGFTNYLSENFYRLLVQDVTGNKKKCFGK